MCFLTVSSLSLSSQVTSPARSLQDASKAPPTWTEGFNYGVLHCWGL